MKRTVLSLAVAAGLVLTMPLFLGGCAPVSANYPQKKTVKKAMDYGFAKVLYLDDDLKVVKKSEDSWFYPEKFDNEIKKMTNKMTGMGMPRPDVVKMMDMRLKSHHSMGLYQKSSSESYAYLGLGLVFEKQTKFAVNKGAFVVSLISSSGEEAVVSDLGMLIKVKLDTGYTYRDSGKGVLEVGWKLQKPDYSKVPNIIRLRFPKEYQGWTVESVSIKPEKLNVI